ncbi:MAG: benzoyl-CoA reductase subunit C [Deltaproteobacteria bacterium]|nr:benzoyl-CoA reductase subunit C [Deltaproteobacteria bacterium]
MSEINDILNRCQELYEDLSLGYVQRWKEMYGKKAVGFLPVYVPRELIRASGMLPVGIMGGGDQIEIIRGDAYFQSYICHIPRSVIEMALSGKLDCLDGMMFPSICDVIRNLSGMWQLMFPEKLSIYFDSPQNFESDTGGIFYQNELKRILDEFSKLSGITATDESLRDATALYNQNRRLTQQLYRRRADKPWEIPTSELYLLLRAGNILEVTEHNQMLERYMALASKENRKPLDNSRLVLNGSFCEQPPLGLIRALERAGGYIVDDDFVLAGRMIKSEIPLKGDPLENIVEAYLKDSKDVPFKYNIENKGDELVESFRENRADGVIFCAASFCDPGLLEQPMLQGRLDKDKIAYTSFQFAENTGQYQVIREQVGTFSDTIKLWGGQ